MFRELTADVTLTLQHFEHQSQWSLARNWEPGMNEGMSIGCFEATWPSNFLNDSIDIGKLEKLKAIAEGSNKLWLKPSLPGARSTCIPAS